ncbi:ATP-binding mismatch repair protein [Savitreella phatthalungensis]
MRAIHADQIQRLQAAQVITCIADVVKELLDNAIDARASKVSIRLCNYGLDSIEITDNGFGIAECDFDALMISHATSKLRIYSDLEKLESLGFRGEALSSICALASVVVTTCTRQSAPVGATLKYNHQGTLLTRKTVAAQPGSQFIATDLFFNLPVRRKDLEKNTRRELSKTVKLIESIAIARPDIRIELIHSVGARTRTVLINTTGSGSTRTCVGEVVHPRLSQILLPFDFLIPAPTERLPTGTQRSQREVRVQGLISPPSYGTSMPSIAVRQFTMVNQRPCRLPQVCRLFNDVYDLFVAQKTPFLIVDVQAPPDSFDVNVSPDKQSIFLHDQDVLLPRLLEHVQHFLNGHSRQMFPASRLSSVCPSRHNAADEPSTTLKCVLPESSDESESPESREVSKRAISWQSEKDKRLKMTSHTDSLVPNRGSAPVKHALETRPHCENVHSSPLSSTSKFPAGSWVALQPDASAARLADSTATDSPETRIPETIEEDVEGHHRGRDFVPTEDPPKRFLPRFSHRLDLFERAEHHSELQCCRQTALSSIVMCSSPAPRKWTSNTADFDFMKAGIGRPQAEAEAALTLHLRKRDFADMRVIGQFNLGFVVAMDAKGQHCFIIDQHASDEKYNYERLMRFAVIDAQPLAVPLKLDLTAADRVNIDEHLEMLRKNGFEVVKRPEADGRYDGEDSDLYLTKLPVSGTIAFGVDDLREVLDAIVDSPWRNIPKNRAAPGSANVASPSSVAIGSRDCVVRCRKARRMFASRACRSSIMIGRALLPAQMRAVLWHMSTMDKPWHCPHGRPTCRHLVALDTMRGWTADLGDTQ